jgi:hypothetical protein
MPTTDTIILDAMNYLQVLNRSITTVTAPTVDKYPTVVDTPSLPFAMTWPSGGEGWQKGPGYIQANRIYRVIVYLQAVAQDDVPSRTVAGAMLMQQFLNLYLNANNTPQAAPPPYQLTIQSGPDGPHVTDGGLVSTLMFRGVQFVGFELAVPVQQMWILT